MTETNALPSPPGPPAPPPGVAGALGRKARLAGIAAAAAGAGLAATMAVPAPMAAVAALTVLCIGLWASAVVAESWTALAFFLVAAVAGLAPPQVVFSGFQTSTFWLLFSGMVLGAAIRHTGLGRRAAAHLSDCLGTGYSGVVGGLVLFGLALAFVMPSSMGRVVLLIPVVVALADHMGYGPGSNGRTGMLLAAAFGTFLPAFAILPSNAPNMILAGMAESLHGQRLAYWDYLLLHFPVLGALKAAVLVVVIPWMFPAGAPKRDAAPGPHLAPMTAAEWRLTGLLGLCLALWLSDGLHHVSPGWIGLAAALYCLWPSAELTAEDCLNKDIQYGSLFFVAAIMGLGAVISASGLGAAAVEVLTRHADLSADRPLWDVGALVAISTVIGIVTNLAGVPAVMTPVAGDLGAATGLPLATVLMTQVVAFSSVLLPHQAPPLVTAMRIGQVPISAVTRLCLAVFVISGLVLVPLDLAWWHLLGLF
jgi:di/tricarboxylate transporter